MAVRGSNQSERSITGLLGIVRDLYVAWKLFLDRRVPTWIKSIPVLSALYVLWPIDILADPVLGLGQLDDLAIVALGIRLFIGLCPPALVAQHQQRLGGAHATDGGDVVDATYRVLDDNE
ncbi:MAG: DUF1232 domain-containing protein [Chloroflexi bacterium]|jgi:uncharacterized membrane protein YkvA (DUF1232 family)|nr:DUF1232 domain-containing protein [Chloroflexota bacterium]